MAQGALLTSAAPAPLAAVDLASYRENGYLVVADALHSEEIAQLRAEAARICRGERGALRNGLTHGPAESDEEVIRQYLCIHFPHKISPLMHAQLSHPAIVRVLTQIIGPDVKCMQSMLFIKSAGKPGQAWHQDEDFIPTRDRSLTGAWLALDDAGVENGCLWVLPGSHRHGVLWPLEQQDDPRFDCTDESQGFPWRDEDALPVEVSAGSVVFFNGYLLHRSLPNRAPGGHRRALVNHYMSAQSLLPWMHFAEGTRAATADYRDVVMVAGVDPYAWKGVTDVARPSVRPSGEGGCAR